MIHFDLIDVFRACPRVSKMPVSVYIVSDGKMLINYKVENISARGILLSGGPRLELHTSYRLIVNFLDSSPFAITGCVVRHQVDQDGKFGYGVVFQNIDPDIEDYIHNEILAFLEQQQEVSPSILVVDSCMDTRKAISRELSPLNMPILMASTSLDAFRLLADKNNQIRVVIVDMFLDLADGVQLLKLIEQKYPHIRRILISAQTRFTQLNLAVETGRAHAAFAKPWEYGEIAKAIAV